MAKPVTSGSKSDSVQAPILQRSRIYFILKVLITLSYRPYDSSDGFNTVGAVLTVYDVVGWVEPFPFLNTHFTRFERKRSAVNIKV